MITAMPLLHDPAIRSALERRLSALTADAHRRWGTMTVDQMLHHVNHALNSALGREPSTLEPAVPLPKALIKFAVLYLPWPKGAPTAPEWISSGEQHYDFEAEKQRTHALLAEVVRKPIDAADWPVHSMFGVVGGDYWSRINAKHLDHHLKQFGA